MTNYTVSLDRRATIITFGITSILMIATVTQSGLFGPANSSAMFTAILLAIVYGVSFALSPKEYIITETSLIIKKRLGNTVFNRNDIENVSLLPEDALNGSVRTFGVGGLFGYYGKFYNTNLGKMTWYITRKNPSVLITTAAGKKIILSPNEASAFVEDLATGNKI